MNKKRDSYRDDGFRKVDPFSTGNLIIAIFLILIVLLVGLPLWLSPERHVIDFEQEQVIPWKPHPPVKRESLLDDGHKY